MEALKARLHEGHAADAAADAAGDAAAAAAADFHQLRLHQLRIKQLLHQVRNSLYLPRSP